MKDIKEVYPDAIWKDEAGEEHFWSVSDYRPLLESFGYKILLQVDDDGYQGDTRVLFKDGNRYGLLIFGWGSCSGCDALQACSSYEEIDELRQQLHNDIKWGTAEELLEYIQGKDWELEWAWHEEETREFIRKAIEILQQEKIC
ncbi:hypothetical protein H0A61_03000 [Koleobacter methoxysyntrophicus]|uniref:Uncharacterized protein n=1 Tax=Koleobacter methoxysyntrophicus TaxID=2751313 RepID=A0A8A0RST0_9FIRM|nr:hypothetical protein [Koleobacter methoxysyntrophicus]QSQ10590.1 hypothetical protein H0A61_03000 [Koleobacter methoxysyntrophicus]